MSPPNKLGLRVKGRVKDNKYSSSVRSSIYHYADNEGTRKILEWLTLMSSGHNYHQVKIVYYIKFKTLLTEFIYLILRTYT